jgi:hypothetical protein
MRPCAFLPTVTRVSGRRAGVVVTRVRVPQAREVKELFRIIEEVRATGTEVILDAVADPLPHMVQRGGRAVVNVASLGAVVARSRCRHRPDSPRRRFKPQGLVALPDLRA